MASNKILIATPAFGEVFYTPYVHSMFRLHRALTPKNWRLSFASIAYSDIIEARNFLLTQWFDKTDCSHLLFVDADMGFEAELVLDMLALKKPLVGTIYTRRQIDLGRLAKLAAGGERSDNAIARAHDFIVRPMRSRPVRRINGFIEVEGCGAGLLLIQRACIAAMLKKMPDISDTQAPKTAPIAKTLSRLIRAFDPIITNGGRLSEDFSFCHRWRSCSGEIWARADKTVTHIGLHRFEARYADARTTARVVLKPEALKLRRGGAPRAAAPKPSPREAGARNRKERGNGAAKREEPEPATAEQVTLAFLRGQIDSPRWGRHYLAYLRRHRLRRAKLIDQADLLDARQNAARTALLNAASGSLFEGFPGDTAWVHRTIPAAGLGRLKYMNSGPWLQLSGGTRRVADGARNLGSVMARDGPFSINAHVEAVIKAVGKGMPFPDLILVQGDKDDLILLEGHARATAYVAAQFKGHVRAFVGSSPGMRRWKFF
jgi:hypothetical protein